MTQGVLEKIEPELLWRGTIYGRPVSKSNRQVVMVNWKPVITHWEQIRKCSNPLDLTRLLRSACKAFYATSNEKRQYMKDFAKQATKKPYSPIVDRIFLKCEIWYAVTRSDLDEGLIMDCLQDCGIIKNDNLIWAKHITKHIDPSNPRAEIELWSMGLF